MNEIQIESQFQSYVILRIILKKKKKRKNKKNNEVPEKVVALVEDSYINKEVSKNVEK
jgi:hypothetical protein